MYVLTDEQAAAVHELLENMLADEDNTGGYFDTTSGGACSAEDIATIRGQWADVHQRLAGATQPDGYTWQVYDSLGEASSVHDSQGEFLDELADSMTKLNDYEELRVSRWTALHPQHPAGGK